MNFSNGASLSNGTSTPRVSLGAGDLVNDAWGIQKTSLPHSLFHGLFTFDIPESQWFTYTNGTQVYGGTDVTSIHSMANVKCSTTSTSVILESRECPRYQPNRGHLFSNALMAPFKDTDGTREWGLQTAENGVFFRMKKGGDLFAVRKSGGTQVTEELINTSRLGGFDVEKGNIYDIQYQWRGVGNYNFFIGDPSLGVSKLVHQFKLLGTLDELSMENPALPTSHRCYGTSANCLLKIGCVDISSENGDDDRQEYMTITADSIAVTTDTPVLCIRNPLLQNGQTNTRSANLVRINVTCSKIGTFKVWKLRDPSKITGATFANMKNGSILDADSSIVGGTKASSVNLSGLTPIITIPVEAAVPRSVDNPFQSRILYYLVRGDYLVITCTAATATASAVIEFGEEI